MYAIRSYYAYPLGRFLEHVWYNPISNSLHWMGAFWFAGMLYLTLLIALTDIIRLVNVSFSFLPPPHSIAYIKLKTITGISITCITLLIISLGFINAWNPKINRITLNINKNANNLDSLKIVAASDIHLGTIINTGKSQKLINTINGLNPDIILLAGDIVDEDVEPVIKHNLGKHLQQLKAKYGTWGITGNHEYIGGADRTVKYLEQHGIKILRDSSVLIDSAFYIVGREDREKTNFTGIPRKELIELSTHLDHTKPIILLDHQPWQLDKATQAKIDLQISGHTHHGQLWPFGFVTQHLFELSSGYLKKENSHFIVSTGFGTWVV